MRAQATGRTAQRYGKTRYAAKTWSRKYWSDRSPVPRTVHRTDSAVDET
jgi:hypothetical protein